MADMDATVESATDPIALNELKQQAMKYYRENGVPQKMEEILNQMFYDKPQDVFGHLVRTKFCLQYLTVYL